MTNILQQVEGKARTGLFIFGLLTLLAGIAILVWPGKTAEVVTAIFAVYTIVAGVAYFATGIVTFGMGFGARIWRIILGALFIVAGIVALSNLAVFSAFFFIFMAIMIGITWIYEGIITFTSLEESASKGWAITFAILSILAGLMVVVSTFGTGSGAFILWWAIGAAGVIYGFAEMVAAIALGRN